MTFKMTFKKASKITSIFFKHIKLTLKLHYILVFFLKTRNLLSK